MGLNHLQASIGKTRFPNPLLLASGVAGASLDKVLSFLSRGAGGVVTKSIGLRPRKGYPPPNIARLEFGLVNAIGLSNPGVTFFAKDLRNRNLERVIVSIFASDPRSFASIVSKIDKYSFAGYELNLSCPHVKGIGTEVGHIPELVSDVVKAVKKNTKKLVIAKLSPNTERLVDVALAAEDAGADAITAINTVKAMVIDLESGKPALSNKYGGLSGAAIKPIALRCVYELYQNIHIPIIGCGGISKWSDAAEFFLAGASLVQLGTAVAYNEDIFVMVSRGLSEYLAKKGIMDYRELIGLAH